MEDAVRRFNQLPRPGSTPSGLPNHWVFKVSHVPLQPPGDLVIVVHPRSYFILQAGPAQILSLPTLADKAEALIPLLLQTFVKSIDPAIQPFSPWSWATEDAEMAAAVEEKLRLHGVKEELCRVGVCSAEDAGVLHEAYSGLVGQLVAFMGQDARTRRAARTASGQ